MTIKEARTAAGLTRQEMYEIMGIPVKTIQKWELGERTPPQYVEKPVIEKLLSFKQ